MSDMSRVNFLHNGDFSVRQRGESFTSTGGANNDGAYTYDRWYLLSDGNDIVDLTISNVPPPVGYPFPGRSRNRLVFDVETANKKFGVAQIIESRDCLSLIDGSVCLSFEAMLGTGSITHVKAAILQWSGTSDAPTRDFVASWNADNVDPTLVAGWSYLSTPTDLNVSATAAIYTALATVADDADQNLAVFIWSDSTSSTVGHKLLISDVQLERGEARTAYQWIPYGDQLARCQRFYEVLRYNSSGQGFVPALYSGSTYVGFWFFKQTKFKAPTVALATGSWTGGTPAIVPDSERCYFTRTTGSFLASGTHNNVALTASADF